MNKYQLEKSVQTITHLEAYGNYTYIHFADAPRQLFARTLGYFAQQLPQFVRIHKSYLVNPAYVAHYEKSGGVTATLQVSQYALPISKRRFSDVKLRFRPKTIPKNLRHKWHYVPLG